MSNNWSYVIVGYAITGATLVGYVGVVRIRSRHAPAAAREESGD